MDHFISNLKAKYQEGDILLRLLYINIGVFLLIRLADVLLMLFNYPFAPLLRYLEFPSAPMEFLLQPWSVLTYMFTHYDVLHILFNMLWLYWFGRMFLNYFDARKLFGVYLLGGIFGALLFMVAYNLFPYYADTASCSYLLGASGNAGGHLAHIGGALFGIWFASRMRSGKDLTRTLNRLIDKVTDLFRKKPKMKVTYKRTETDYEYKARKREEEMQINPRQAEAFRLSEPLVGREEAIV